VATDITSYDGHSLCKASAGPAIIKVDYRFIRNQPVDVSEIMQAGLLELMKLLNKGLWPSARYNRS